MILIAAATLAGACLQSAAGFGFALVLAPALFALLEPREAVGVLLALGLVLNLLVLLDGRPREAVRWGALPPLLGAAAPGLALGALALALAPRAALQLAVGAAVLAAAVVQLRRGAEDGAAAPARRLGGRAGGSSAAPTRQLGGRAGGSSAAPARRGGGGSLAGACAAGLASGALTTSISVSGPPLVLWLEASGLRAAELRATLAAAFLALNLAGAAVLAAGAGAGSIAQAGLVAPLAALVVAGHLAGARAFRRLDERRFRTLALGVVGAAGVASLAAGLGAL